MEVFFSDDIGGGRCRLSPEESRHCVKVMRHRTGDEIHVIDGRGSMMDCRIEEASADGVVAVVSETHSGWGGHPYELVMAVCPTKNNERFEWFVEKAVEVGVDSIVPVIGDRSERKEYKIERACRIALSAAKQSLKGAVPAISAPVTVRDFIAGSSPDALRLIACCFDVGGPRISVCKALGGFSGRRVEVLIGPEGDFSAVEAETATAAGFVPVSLGASRLRTETAALTAVEAVYLRYME